MSENNAPANLKTDNASRVQAMLKSRLQKIKTTGETDLTVGGPATTAATGEAPAATLETLRSTYAEDRIYKVPTDWIDFIDTTFFNRQELEELLAEPETDEIKTSLLKFGQQVPCICQFNEAGKLQVIDGWRRSLCIQDLKEKGIKDDGIKVQIVKLDTKTAAQLSAVANFARKDLPDFQKASYINKLCTHFEIPKDEVAEMTGYGKRYIYRILSLYDQENSVILDALSGKKVGLTLAIHIAEKTTNMSPSVKEKMIADFVEGQKEDHAASEKTESAAGERASGKKKKKKAKDLSAYFISDSETGRFKFHAALDPRKTTVPEIDTIIQQLPAFKEALLKLKKELKKS